MQLFISTGLELLILFGIFFVFGFVLSKLEQWTLANYYRSVGWKGILWTAWIGTSVHEIGHVFFAEIFGHQITRVALFSPNKMTGELGEVDHAYNPQSIYQTLGNFFIGAAPLLFGIFILIAIGYFGAPHNFQEFKQAMHSWFFWVLMYISFCISSHLAPSRQDLKSMWIGFAQIIVLLIFFNLVAAFFRYDLVQAIYRLYPLGNIFKLLAYVLGVSVTHCLVSWMISRLFRLR